MPHQPLRRCVASSLRRFSAAFSLVELLVVIGIISVLIGILLPAMSRARDAANKTKCLANLRTLGQAMVMYANAHKGKLPNLKQLADDGAFRTLGSTQPSESPTAWSSFATGVNPGRHNIYDFLVRDPQTYAPDFTFNLGLQYAFTLGSGDVITPRINYGHVAEQWATLFQDEARGDLVEARNIVNAQVVWQHGEFFTTLFGSNITDQHYVGAVNSGLRFAGAPMFYGLRITKAF